MKKLYAALRLLLCCALSLSLGLPAYAGTTITYIHNDIAGTPVAASDSAGKLLWKESYYPYGEQIRHTGDSTNEVWFHGKPFDKTTGLSYFGARYYDPVIGRFMGIDPVAVDPTNFHSFNRYAYANNNPYKYTDPDGRMAQLLLRASWGIAWEAGLGLSYGFQALTGVSIGVAVWNATHNEADHGGDESKNTAPPVPDDYVGVQGEKSGTSVSGNRHTSGPLAPENGGTGDAQKDFDKLTGSTGKPFPKGDKRAGKPGVEIGDNGVWIRPGTKKPGDGPRIEIPGNGNKLPETLHY